MTRIRRLFDIRRAELAPVAFSFAYVAVIVASFLLAKPVRDGLFLQDYGAYALVYAYAAVPVALSILVPLASRIAVRIGQRAMIVASLWFFCANVLLFWVLFRFARVWLLPAILYVWVNCYSAVAPVQAWSFVSSLFDTRQAKRLYGLIGAGASLGAIAGGALGRLLIGPVGGAVNLLLVLAVLIAAAAFIVSAAIRRLPRHTTRVSLPATGAGAVRAGAPVAAVGFHQALRSIAASPYLRLIVAVVFFVAIATQWVGFQLKLEATARFSGDADRLTHFFSSFAMYTGLAAFAFQLFLTGRVLRRFGLAAAILLLPLALMSGSLWILIAPAFWPVLITAGFDQGLRFSLDKASYEMLYLPLVGRQRAQLKAAIDIVVNRIADAVGAVLLGVVTGGFLGIGGFGLGLRGTAAINLCFIAAWAAAAWRLRSQYVAAIGTSIRTHRLEAERAAAAARERTGAAAIHGTLASADERDVAYALDVLEAEPDVLPHPALRSLLRHSSDDVRRRAMRLLNESGDQNAAHDVGPLIRDSDLETRAEALLYLSRHADVDPIAAVRDLERFPEYAIRASMAAFLAAPGEAQNVEAARVILRAMMDESGPDAARVRREASRLVELRPEIFEAELRSFLDAGEEDPEVLRYAARAVGKLKTLDLAPLLIPRLANPEIADEAGAALASIGERVLPLVEAALLDPRLALDARRELPIVLARIGTAAARQMLVDALLQTDAALRYRIIASLNKLRQAEPRSSVDRSIIDLVLAAEITGHYRSYQVLLTLQQEKRSEELVKGLRHAMEHELERIFRLIALAMPDVDLHSAYVALNALDRVVRANAIEFLESSLEPELMRLLLPLIDPQVSVEERARLADRLVGAKIDSLDGAIQILLVSEDAWLRETARAARERLWAAEPETAREETTEPAAMGSGV
ncbi:MAG TPA: Npt1/Npt2 family nucleotide transporter [Vicinamibacterales bacterium]|nr:Npt1/Npt2 family nucleotide transporter [Vicinamibacterales bacterium]